ncbi:ABC transporter permease [Actibacterium sp. 188UL27-1]|uniref:ABC transporter permease n=1 Tax=Actibacterium sp. 188UL27-1 TaxID=2786961 RepID=UPI00195B592A|nr:ABC transporter permease subunit [Actibacterium sp. 188UL27-1]MBM7068654.1 ABC transporter permease subunit [Actibacterium sp. 188UL27-1]
MADRAIRIPVIRLGITPGRVGLVIGLGLLIMYATLWIGTGFFDLSSPEEMDLLARLAPPSAAHPLGTDHLGRDVLSRLLAAIPISLGAALATMAAILAIALPWGLLAGLTGGRVDMVMMRVADIVLAFPTLVLALAVIGFLGASLEASIIGVVVAWWPSNARLVRAMVLSAKERDFVRAAYLAGASRTRVVIRHILPQILPPLAVVVSLETASVLLALSSLSFLGIGAQPPTPEWGAMLNEARPFLVSAPHMLLAPGLAVMLAVFAFNLVGEALRDLLDQREPFIW